MTNRAEFERLLDVYGFRCERFGQDLSTHARAQVVSAFAALASAPVVRGPAKERADFAIWLTRTFPSLYTSADAARFLDDGHQAAMAWQAHWKAGGHISTMTGAPVAGEAQPAIVLKAVDEYGPQLDWTKHWVEYPVGTKFYAAPQASEAVRLPAKMPKHQSDGSEYPSTDSYQEGYAEGWNDAIDAALSAQPGAQKGCRDA